MMQKTFDSFYFLHIRKTGGRSYINNFIMPIKDTIKSSGINWLIYTINETAHTQWIDEITDLTYVTCTFREPCEQIVGIYGQRANETIVSNIDKKSFFQWFDSDAGRYNYNNQSKNIVSPVIHVNKFETRYNDELTTKENVLNKISKMSLFLKKEELVESNRLIIQNKILSDLRTNDKKIDNKKWEHSRFVSNHSQQVYDSLTKKEKEYIKSACFLDSEIYETDTLFWKP